MRLGAMRVFLTGDLCQQLPISRPGTTAARLAFQSEAWWDARLSYRLLRQGSRQGDDAELRALPRSLRLGRCSSTQWSMLLRTRNNDVDTEGGALRATATSAEADSYNDAELSALPGEATVRVAEGEMGADITGANGEAAGTRRQFPIRLACAVTVRELRGLTVPWLVIDATHVRGAGRLYTAPSSPCTSRSEVQSLHRPTCAGRDRRPRAAEDEHRGGPARCGTSRGSASHGGGRGGGGRGGGRGVMWRGGGGVCVEEAWDAAASEAARGRGSPLAVTRGPAAADSDSEPAPRCGPAGPPGQLHGG